MENKTNSKTGNTARERYVYLINGLYGCKARNIKDVETLVRDMDREVDADLWNKCQNGTASIIKLSEVEYNNIVEKALKTVAKKYSGFYAIQFDSPCKYVDISSWASEEAEYNDVEVKVVFDDSYNGVYTVYMEMKGNSGGYFGDLPIMTNGEYNEDSFLAAAEKFLDHFLDKENE